MPYACPKCVHLKELFPRSISLTVNLLLQYNFAVLLEIAHGDRFGSTLLVCFVADWSILGEL